MRTRRKCLIASASNHPRVELEGVALDRQDDARIVWMRRVQQEVPRAHPVDPQAPAKAVGGGSEHDSTIESPRVGGSAASFSLSAQNRRTKSTGHI